MFNAGILDLSISTLIALHCWIFCTQRHTHTHTHTYSVGFLWTRDQPIVGNFTWQHTTPTWDRRTYRRRYLNPHCVASERPQTYSLYRAATCIWICYHATQKKKMFWPFCNVFMLLLAKSPCCVITSQESSFRISRFPNEICHCRTNVHEGSYPKDVCFDALLTSLRILYFKWMQVYLTCCMALLITFWPSTWRALGSDINFVHWIWYTPSLLNIFLRHTIHCPAYILLGF